MKFTISILILIFLNLNTNCVAQSEVVKAVQLDSVMIEAVDRGFSVEDFIQLVKDDTSFYKAFKNLHYFPYRMHSDLYVFNKELQVVARQERKARQYVKDRKKWVVIEVENVSGKFYKRKKKFRYYTAEMLDRIFFKTDTLFASNRIGNSVTDPDSNIEKLKILIFNPGAEVSGVPGAGKKLAIFDDRMSSYYNYKIESKIYRDSIQCYVFSVKVKDKEMLEKGKVVIEDLVTYFNKRDFTIVARNYDMAYSSLLFDLDVSIKVDHFSKEGNLLPIGFSYNGYWKIAGKRAEIIKFAVSFDDYN
ncbi:MAG: hypothetical protein HKN22_06800 [Bacteroidia bacterium]|nr:hypothetical protein [Bacteroidia bacterium]